MIRHSKQSTRRGFSFLELQVALILLGIALAGLIPLVVMQSKQLKLIEQRWDPDWSASQIEADYWIDPYFDYDDGPVYDVLPPQVSGCAYVNSWARTLGVPARLVPRQSADFPTTQAAEEALPATKNTVTFVSYPEPTSASATATVSVTYPE
jgi:prepilin-type N-terminal cleavage/methylation domain-containing protein